MKGIPESLGRLFLCEKVINLKVLPGLWVEFDEATTWFAISDVHYNFHQDGGLIDAAFGSKVCVELSCYNVLEEKIARMCENFLSSTQNNCLACRHEIIW